MMGRLLLIGALLAPVAAAADVAAALKSTCEGVAKKYDVSCSMALYGRSGGTTLDATSSAGFIDGGLGLGTKAVPASDDDVYVYGSITKMFTASAIYQLAREAASASATRSHPYEAWKAFDQAAAAKGTLSKASKFVDAGPCDAFTPVKGFMEQRRGPTIEVSDALYGLEGIVTNASLADMTYWGDGRFAWYGAGTFDLAFSATYFPDYGFTLAVATNAEMEAQAQPGDARACVGFHAVLAALGLGPALECAFVVPRGRRFMGTCECKNATALP
ncbi:beta-lactamase [Aureococcus anophagefferens]|uniref:Beta-lactamase n=1 Tax=Aureococcus anophagefferens TaxID=44056 RepID=A0ABR1G8W4_AURAN